MKIELKPEQIAYPNGLEIAVEGFTVDPDGVRPSQLVVEVHDGALRVHVWTTEDPDPTVRIEIHPPLPPKPVPTSGYTQGDACHP